MDPRSKALSPTDIFKIAGKTCNVLKYPELSRFNDINEVFEEGSSLYNHLMPDLPFDENTCILLYMTRPNFGHWCTIKRFDDRIDFLDPYGDQVDDQLDFINKKFRDSSNQDRAHLCRLLLKSPGREVHYNDLPIQLLDSMTATCGRYAALFLKHDLHVEDFVNQLVDASLKYRVPIDDIVSYIV